MSKMWKDIAWVAAATIVALYLVANETLSIGIGIVIVMAVAALAVGVRILP